MKRKLQLILTLWLALFLLSLSAVPAYAADNHLNPEDTQEVFSQITLLEYFSHTMNHAILLDDTQVSSMMQKIPYAHIPENITTPSNIIAEILPSVTLTINTASSLVEKLGTDLSEANPDKIAESLASAVEAIETAGENLSLIENNLYEISNKLNILSLPKTDNLRLTYEELFGKFERLQEMVGIYESIVDTIIAKITKLEDALSYEEIVSEIIGNISNSDGPAPVLLSIDVSPSSIFVGDSITTSGTLFADVEALSDKTISVFLNGTLSGSAQTNSNGDWETIIAIPYWYINEVRVQAFYTPDPEDQEEYLPGISSVIPIQLQYYAAETVIELKEKTQPGTTTEISVTLDYGEGVPPIEREWNLYFNDVLTDTLTAENEIISTLQIPDKTEPGVYPVSIKTPGLGRYAPVNASGLLEITVEPLVLDVHLSNIIFVPGSTSVSGSVSSALGIPEQAVIDVSIGNNTNSFEVSEDGSFSGDVDLKMEFGLVGSDIVSVRVNTASPMFGTSIVEHKVLSINYIICGIFIVLILLVGIVVPKAYKYRGKHPKQNTQTDTLPPGTGNEIEKYTDPSPVYDGNIPGVETAKVQNNQAKVISIYKVIVAIVRSLTNITPGKNQTLREFSGDSGKLMGKFEEYFDRMTRMVEKILYSNREATDDDLRQSEELKDIFQRGATDEDV